MSGFNSELLISNAFSFDETSLVLLDELTQARIIEGNLRLCFSLRVSSRIMSMIYLNGRLSEENNFLTNMTALTRRITDVFNVFYDFIKPDENQNDFHQLIGMMNNSIIDFISHEFNLAIEAKNKGECYEPLTIGQIHELVHNVLITQKYEFNVVDEEGQVNLAGTKGHSISSVKHIVYMSVWGRLRAIIHNLLPSAKSDNELLIPLVDMFSKKVDQLIDDVFTSYSDANVSSAVVYSYNMTCMELLCDIIYSLNRQGTINISMGNEMIITAITNEFMSAVKQMVEHVRFLVQVNNENNEDAE